MEWKLFRFDLTDEEFLHIAKWAHEQDITFNQMVAKILEQLFWNRKHKMIKTEVIRDYETRLDSLGARKQIDPHK